MVGMETLFGKRSVLDDGYVELFDAMIVDPRLKIVNAARVSFNAQATELTDRDLKLIRYLREHGHLSTFRHSCFSFRVRAPIFVFRQWWKYQVGSAWEAQEGVELASPTVIPDTSWNEMSGRYVQLEPAFHVPTEFRGQAVKNRQGSEGIIDMLPDGTSPAQVVTDVYTVAYDAYCRLIDGGVAREQARMVLPFAIYSECVWTCSLQSLLHFLDQRLGAGAQQEIKEYARAIYGLLKPILDDIEELNPET